MNRRHIRIALLIIFTAIFTALIYLSFPAPTEAAAGPGHPSVLTIHLEGKSHQLLNPLIVKNGVTYAPFREIFTLVGAEVGYISRYGRLLVWAELEGHRFLLEKGTTAFYYNNTLLSLPEKPPLIEGALYFPLRFLLDLAGYNIHWATQQQQNDNAEKAADIYLSRSNNQQIAPNKGMPPVQFNPRAAKIPVLMYHHLLPADEYDGSSGTTIFAEAFGEQMDYLFANGYRTVTLEDLYLFVTGEKELPPKTVVITFDDGYQSNYTYAYPVLQQYRFRAAQFPITSYLNGKKNYWVPHMTWKMMENSADVFEFHSHSHDLHYYVGEKQAVFVVGTENVLEDLKRSRGLLDCFAFSYPFGAYNEEIIALLQEAGYKMAFNIRPGYVFPGDDPFQLKRFGVYPETTIEDFAWLLEHYR